MAVAGERLEPLGVADPLGRLLPDEEVAGAPHDRDEVVVVGVVGGQRLDPEDELVVRERQPALVARAGGRRRSAAARRARSSLMPPLSRSTRPAGGTPRRRRRGPSAPRGRSPSKLIPNRNPPRGAGRAQRTVAGMRTWVAWRPRRASTDERVPTGGRLGVGVDAPPALADVGQEAGHARFAEDVAAGRDERLDALGLPLLLGARPWGARTRRRAYWPSGAGAGALVGAARRC